MASVERTCRRFRDVAIPVMILLAVCSLVRADSLVGLSNMTAVGDAIVSLSFDGTEYSVANGDLLLGNTTRWWVNGEGDEILWDPNVPESAPPTDPPPVPNTSSPKAGDIGAHADNFLLRDNGANNLSSLDGINFQETIFPVLSSTFFLFERGGNDSGTWQAILADDTLGPAVQFTGSTDYADTGVGVSGQNAWGVAFLTDQPVKGVRVTASGHDTLSISIPIPEPSSLLLIIVGACGVAWSTRGRTQRAS